ncbi:MAG: NADH-quinone oxidoreductase subunit G [Coxiellaceae bacterium]|nr:NADH-quinone oxidoreductase subunit G [Coxiellaceae bacterium]
MLELTIDDKPVSVNDGATIIEAADLAGIYIPRFCYHKKLSIAANCRMCLIEVEGSRKPLPACATPATNNMVVYTASKMALEAQRIVMEFLLVNHPLDCPVCDQGGVCELQDLSVGFGRSHSDFEETKVAVHSPDLGPLIDTHMTRCIKCTRCVRFGEEIAGISELGVLNRGEHSTISNYMSRLVHSELSGNVIDICPVGALTAKPSKYAYRGWEVHEHEFVAGHDCVGSNIFVHCRRHDNYEEREIMNVVPRQNESINEAWISDRDRFSYQALSHESRILEPSIKQQGQWKSVGWQRALVEIADKLRGLVEKYQGDALSAIASPNSTTEECYLLQKLVRSLGSNHVDFRIREQDFTDQEHGLSFTQLGVPIKDLVNMETIMVVGSDVRHEQPILSHRINQASQSGAVVMSINPIEYDTVFPVQHSLVDGNMISPLAQIVSVLLGEKARQFPGLETVSISDAARAMAAQLQQSSSGILLLGEYALGHQQASLIRALAACINEHTSVTVGFLTPGANAAGAYLAGAVPHRDPSNPNHQLDGRHAMQLLTDQPSKAYIVLGAELEHDCAYSEAALKVLSEASLVVCLSSYTTPEMLKYADFILPVAPFVENTGSYVNVEGVWQSFSAATVPQGQSKPAWKVIRALAGFMMLDNFDYKTTDQVIGELKTHLDTQSTCVERTNLELAISDETSDHLLRLAPWPMYRSDAFVRKAEALQTMHNSTECCITINNATAKRLGLVVGDMTLAKQGSSQIQLPLRADDAVGDNVVVIPSGNEETKGFGQASANINLSQEVL